MQRSAPQAHSPRIGLLSRGDRETGQQSVRARTRLASLARAALAEMSATVDPIVYDDDRIDELHDQLIGLDGVLVWVDPVRDGADRSQLDALLRRVTARGVWVSAHPDAVMRMGTKEVLFTTRDIGWGTDTALYRSQQDFERRFPERLRANRVLVVKQGRGTGGAGVWNVELIAHDANDPAGAWVRVQHAETRDTSTEEMVLARFLERCRGYFAWSGFMVDQPFQERLADGMIRCYLVHDQVAGFWHHWPTGLLDRHDSPAALRVMEGADAPAYHALRKSPETEWIPRLKSVLSLEATDLPVIWDADFLFGPRTDTGAEHLNVLCEINASCVWPFPEQAVPAIATAALARIEDARGRLSALKVVNSYDEWTPLEEVIVGTPYHLDYHVDTSFRLFFYENIQDPSNRGVFDHIRPSNQLRDECDEDLAAFVEILEARGIAVRRPETVTTVPTVQTPHWRAPAVHALMSRDPFLVVGDEIIETSPQLRSRYFEGDMYTELFTDYFNRGARWTVAPRSRLLDRNFDYEYVTRLGFTGEIPADPFYEIMFDGAQVMRLGRDLVFNASTENHRMGARWLARHLGKEFRVHCVRVADNHTDGKVLPLRPGLLLARDSVDLELLPEELRKWDVIRYEWLDVPVEVEQDGVPFLASQSIGINLLSLDEQTVVVQDIQKPLILNLETAGLTVVPCRWRHGRSLGGGFHCVTLDIRRQGGLESYLQWEPAIVRENEREHLRDTFGQDAALYDRCRPGYPAQLFDDLAGATHLGLGSRVLEVGCGTGQATLPLARLGCAVTAVGLSPAMAAVARRNLAGFPAVRVVVSAFEDLPKPGNGFDAVVSASAFHWVDPDVRMAMVADALRPGGVLAVIATHHVTGGTDSFFAEVQRTCYERFPPDTEPGLRILPAPDDVTSDIDDSPRFGPALSFRYEWSTSYNAREYTDLLSTYSGHRATPAGRRNRLLDCIADFIDSDYGGVIHKRHLTLLTIVRRVG